MSLELRPEVAAGTYSNLAIITHSHSEFIIDFAKMLPGMPKPDICSRIMPDICSRIIMTPEHAKRLLAALTDNVSKYENNFGPISLESQPSQRDKGNTFNLGDFPPFNNGAKS